MQTLTEYEDTRSTLADIERSCIYLDTILKLVDEVEENINHPGEIYDILADIEHTVEIVRKINKELRDANWELNNVIYIYEHKIEGLMEEL